MLIDVNFKNISHQLQQFIEKTFQNKTNKQSHLLQIFLTWYNKEHQVSLQHLWYLSTCKDTQTLFI